MGNMRREQNQHGHITVAGTGFAVLDRVYADGGAPLEAMGGSCANVLVSLAMLDHSVAPVLALGEDQVGARLRSEFHAAGANVDYISLRAGVASPVLTQRVDTDSGQHYFSFFCLDTHEPLPRYQPIEDIDVERASEVLGACSVFYADRLSVSILDAMERAHRGGAYIYFEPSTIDHGDMFARAVSIASIFKCSSERLVDVSSYQMKDGVRIVTHGAKGLEIMRRGHTYWSEATPAVAVRDTCGSGDMVSVGVIDWLLAQNRADLDFDMIMEGVSAGQRLAAANCAFVGARGLFSTCGVDYARRLLDGRPVDVSHQLELFAHDG